MAQSFLVFPPSALTSFQARLQAVKSNPGSYSELEIAEAFEAVGVAHFYGGRYKESIDQFQTALEKLVKKLKISRIYSRISVLVGIAFYRLGETSSAEKSLLPITSYNKAVDGDLVAAACSNLASIYIHQGKYRDGIDKAKLGVDIAGLVFSNTSSEFLRHVRILLLAYIKSGQFNRAEALLEDTHFPRSERALLSAACKFAGGRTSVANGVLQEEKMEIAEDRLARKALALQQMELALTEKEQATLAATARGDVEGASSSSSSASATVQPVNPVAIASLDSTSGLLRTPSREAMGSSSSSFRASPGSPVAGTELGSKQASPSAGMIDDDDNIDGGQQKHRQLPDLPAAGADHFAAAQLLYNLSAIHARRYEYADAKLLLVQATEEMRAYVTAVQQERVNVNTIHMMAKTDSEGYEKFLQQFLDPWNPVPACMTVDAMTVPIALMSQIMAARTEAEIMSAVLPTGREVQQGAIVKNIKTDEDKVRLLRRIILRARHQYTETELMSGQVDLTAKLGKSLPPGLLWTAQLPTHSDQEPESETETGQDQGQGDIHASVGSWETKEGDGEGEGEKRVAVRSQAIVSVAVSNPVDLPLSARSQGSDGGASHAPSHVVSLTDSFFTMELDEAQDLVDGSHRGDDDDEGFICEEDQPDFESANFDVAASADCMMGYGMMLDSLAGSGGLRAVGEASERILKTRFSKFKESDDASTVAGSVVSGSIASSSRPGTSGGVAIGGAVAVGSRGQTPKSAGKVGAAVADLNAGGSGSVGPVAGSPSKPGSGGGQGLGNLSFNADEDELDERDKLATLQYVATKHDQATVRGELLPLLHQYGRDEITCWVQWAIAMSDGVGYGMMGTNSAEINGDELVAAGKIKKSKRGSSGMAIPVDEPTMKNVRTRLTKLEARLSTQFDEESKYAMGDRERHLMVNAALAKINTQMNKRKEASQCVEKMEAILTSLITVSDKNAVSMSAMAALKGAASFPGMKLANYDPHYVALVKRFRLDFEDWDLPFLPAPTPEKRVARLMVMLSVAKAYYAAAEQTKDIQMQRDSVKRLANLYIEISNSDLTEKKAEKIERKREKPKRYDDDDDGDERPVSNGVNDVAQQPQKGSTAADESVGTLLQLQALNEQEIEEKEKSDVAWVKKFGRLRAMQTVERLKDLANAAAAAMS